MRVAVAGGTGLVGQYTVEALEQAGNDAVVLTRSRRVDLATGEGLDEALAGVEAVVDVTNTPETEPEPAREFFGTASANLLVAEQRAGVGHHVLLSIVGVERVEGNGHYAGKRRQEELVEAGPVPYTILRATQFHEFAGMVAGWTLQGDSAIVPPLLVQPAAASDVGRVLAEIATAPPQGRTLELAGPELQDFVDMARRTLEARGESIHLIPRWGDRPFSVEMAGEVLLPGPEARIGSTTFDDWLASESSAAES